VVAAFTTLQPLFTGTLAAVTLGEGLRANQAVGFVLIVAGLFLVQAGPTRRAPVPAE
jgi:drug/metabolite transporter (DMT)-like permease